MGTLIPSEFPRIGANNGPIAVLYNSIVLSNSHVCSVNLDDSMRLASDEPQPLKGDLSGLELASRLATYQQHVYLHESCLVKL